MFRLVDHPLSFRQQANEWIYKMLFLWAREPIPHSRAGPWFAWFATAAVLWRCRRRISKAVHAMSPLKLFKRRVIPVNVKAVQAPKATATTAQNITKEHQKKLCYILNSKHNTGIKTRVKRLCTGDGPHVTGASFIQTSPMMNYKVTRSGKVYGKYNKMILSKKQ